MKWDEEEVIFVIIYPRAPDYAPNPKNTLTSPRCKDSRQTRTTNRCILDLSLLQRCVQQLQLQTRDQLVSAFNFKDSV